MLAAMTQPQVMLQMTTTCQGNTSTLAAMTQPQVMLQMTTTCQGNTSTLALYQ